MTDLKAILNYQEIDIKLRRTLDSIEKSDAAKRGKQAKSEFDSAKRRVEESEQSAGELVDFFTDAESSAKAAKEQIEELKRNLETEGLTQKARNKIKSELEALKGRLASLEKTVEAKRKQASAVIGESRDAQSRAKKMRDVFLSEKEEFEKIKRQKAAEIDGYRKKLAELRPSIDAKLMALYDGLAAERKLPAFVDAYCSQGNYSCRGCGLQLSQADNSKLSQEGICRCGNCHRVIYVSADKKK